MTQIVRAEPEIDSLARFQSLQAGEYWRARDAIPEQGIPADIVLLIQSIRWVENAPHTVILRSHPTLIGKEVQAEIVKPDGSTSTKFIRYNEHRFLLHDFLNRFQFEPDHQKVRTAELMAVQGRINSLQSELMEAHTNPAILAGFVEVGMQEQQATAQRNAEREGDSSVPAAPALPATSLPGRDLSAMATGTIRDAIGAGITTAGIAELRNAAGREHQMATIKAQWIQGKTNEIATTIRAMTPFYEEQAAAALAQTEDIRTYVAKLMEGIESLDLYVGKDVDVLTVRSGESAPSDVPLTFVQKKLAILEELAVAVDLDEWFDATKHEVFFETLRNNDALVNQIFPTQRCVLVMATTRRFINYGNQHVNQSMDAKNRCVFMLVRDGMNIHRVYSSVESHLGASRLFPSKDDQDRVFQGTHGDQIKFEDVAFTDKVTAHERFALHYKRFLLLACGLDHRLRLFGDFYDGPQTLNFVSMDFQAKHCRFLHDDDGLNMLPGEERVPLKEWIKGKNAYLRSGARVLCNWYEVMNPDSAPGACKRDHHASSGIDRRYTPVERRGIAIAFRQGDEIFVEVEVEGRSYSSRADRKFNCKVNLSKFSDNSWNAVDLPYLCLDAVSPEDLHWYIHNRDTRVDQLSYIRFFKYALAFIHQERAAERATRDRLVQALADGNIAHGGDADDVVQQSVIAWRAANRGRALPEFSSAGEAPAAWASLLDQMYMLAGEGKRRTTDIEAYVEGLGYAPLRLVLSGGAKLVVYAAPATAECDNRIEDHVWVHRITIEKGKTKYLEKSRKWALLPKLAASETTLHEWVGASTWCGRKSGFDSFEAKQKIFADSAMFAQNLQPFTVPMDHAEVRKQLDNWGELRDDLVANAKQVVNPIMAIPFGVLFFPRNQHVRFICVGTTVPHILLHQLAGDEGAKKQVFDRFISDYKFEDSGRKIFGAGEHEWEIFVTSVSPVSSLYGFYCHSQLEWERVPNRNPANPLMSALLVNWADSDDRNGKLWLANSMSATECGAALDNILGLELPEDFDPVRVVETVLTPDESSTDPRVRFARFFDICKGEMEAPNRKHTGFWGRADSWTDALIENSTPAGVFSWHMQSSRQLSHKASPDEARRFIQAQAGGAGAAAILATDIPEAPQPPSGVERWYIMSVTAE